MVRWIIAIRILTEAVRRARTELCRWSNKWAARRRCHDDRWTNTPFSLCPVGLTTELPHSLSLYLSISLFNSLYLSRSAYFSFARCRADRKPRLFHRFCLVPRELFESFVELRERRRSPGDTPLFSTLSTPEPTSPLLFYSYVLLHAHPLQQ